MRNTSHGMKRNDYYSDRKMRDVFGVTGIALLVVKAGETQSWLQDVRFCISCERFYPADLFISTVKFENLVEFVCAKCADEFDRGTDDNRREFFRCAAIADAYWRDQLKMAREAHPTRKEEWLR